MFIDVIPSEHSIGIQPLTYSIPEIFEKKLIPGCIIEIPVKTNTEYGIIVGFRKYAPEGIEVRDIAGIITTNEVIVSYQIALILEISSKYLIPIHRVLGFFLSKPIIKRLEKKNFEQLYHKEKLNYTKKIKQITILKNSIITGEVLKPYANAGTVIVCPDDFTIYRLQKELTNLEDILYIPNESTETKKAQSWIDIKNRKYNIIVGNRKILYYNLEAYSNIIYLEDAFGREYFHYPIKIEYIDILDMLIKQEKFNIHIITSIPKLTTITRFRQFHIEYI